MSNKYYIPYAKQNISRDDIEAVQQALAQPVITRGPQVEAFENEIAAYCGSRYAVAFHTATAGLMAAFHAADVGMSDRIVTTPNSFIATIGGAIQLGATPVFVDIDCSTGNLDLEQTILNSNHSLSNGKTVIVPVHFSGIPVNIQALDASLRDFRTMIIEDAAHAIGSCYHNGSKVGSCLWSQMTVFSFHPAKTITSGEGGIVTTNDPGLWHQLKLYRANGIEKDPLYLDNVEYPGYYEVKFLSGNHHMTEMQAALGISQLKRLDQFIKKRQELMQHYRTKLASIEHLRLFTPAESLSISYHLCVVQIDFSAYKTTRKAVMEQLHLMGIGTQMHYIPLYRHPFFTKTAGDISPYFPEMERYYSQALTLPLYFDLNEEDVDRVVASLKAALSKK